MTAPHERAEEVMGNAIMRLARAEGLCPAGAGRELLVALMRWYGIPDFRRAAESAEEIALGGEEEASRGA